MKTLLSMLFALTFSVSAFAANLTNEAPSKNVEVILNPYYVAAKCTTPTSAEFLKDAKERLGAIIYKATPETTVAIVDYINKFREKNNAPRMDADGFYYAIIPDGNRGTFIGVVFFNDGCVVSGTVEVMSVDNFVSFITSLGLDLEKHFVLVG